MKKGSDPGRGSLRHLHPHQILSTGGGTGFSEQGLPSFKLSWMPSYFLFMEGRSRPYIRKKKKKGPGSWTGAGH